MKRPSPRAFSTAAIVALGVVVFGVIWPRRSSPAPSAAPARPDSGLSAASGAAPNASDSGWTVRDDTLHAGETLSGLLERAGVHGGDAGKILAAIGDPAKLLDNASVSSDTVEGVDSDKVSGDVNIEGVAAAAANLSKSLGDSTATAPSQAEIDKTVTQLKKIVNKAHVDVWVGKSDHKVHRVAFTLDAAMDDATKQSSGIDAATIDFDVTTADASAPDISAPSSVGTPAEFQAAVVGLLGKVMGGAAGG